MRTRKKIEEEKRSVRRFTLYLGVFSLLGLLAHFAKAFGAPPETVWWGKAIAISLTILRVADAGTYLTVMAVIVSFYAVYMQMREAHRMNKFNQSVAAMMHCNSRYDEIVRDQPPNRHARGASAAEKRAARTHWRRYWGLKADQFDMYLTGLIDRDTMASWQVSTIRHFCRHLDADVAGRAPGGMNAIEGWEAIGEPQNETNPWFLDLVRAWKTHADDLSRKPEVERKKTDLLTYVLGQLEIIEPMARAWRRSAHHGNMPLPFYRASLKWPLFAATPPLSSEMQARLDELSDGVAMTPSGAILTD